MIVELVYKTLDMESGKVAVIKNIANISLAIEHFKLIQNNKNIEYAYLRRFDKWDYRHVKWLKEKK